MNMSQLHITMFQRWQVTIREWFKNNGTKFIYLSLPILTACGNCRSNPHAGPHCSRCIWREITFCGTLCRHPETKISLEGDVRCQIWHFLKQLRTTCPQGTVCLEVPTMPLSLCFLGVCSSTSLVNSRRSMSPVFSFYLSFFSLLMRVFSYSSFSTLSCSPTSCRPLSPFPLSSDACASCGP